MLYSFNNFNDIIKKLKEHNERQEKIIKQLREKVNTFNKQETIQKCYNQLESTYAHSLSQLTDKELHSMKTFIDKHYHSECHNGNHYIYDITGTGLGACITIKCPKCGESEDITDEDKF